MQQAGSEMNGTEPPTTPGMITSTPVAGVKAAVGNTSIASAGGVPLTPAGGVPLTPAGGVLLTPVTASASPALPPYIPPSTATPAPSSTHALNGVSPHSPDLQVTCCNYSGTRTS